METKRRDIFQEVGHERRVCDLEIAGEEDTAGDMFHSPNVSVIPLEWY